MPSPRLLRRALAGALAAFLSAFAAAGFPGKAVFRSYGIEEDLGSLAVNALAQDTDGFLWIGTELGLYRFDGTRFAHLGRGEGLPGDTVSGLWADPHGGVWVAAGRSTRRVQGLQVLPEGEGLPEGPLLGMARDGEGRLWIAKGRLGLFREEAPGRFARVDSWPRAWLVAWAPRAGGLVVAGPAGRMEVWRNGQVAQVWGPAHGLGQDPYGVGEDGQGRLWVLDGQGLLVKDPGEPRFRKVEHPVVRSGGQVRNLASDGRGGFWIATVHGLLRVRDGRLEALTEREGLPAHGATAVLQDREGNLWCGAGGLFRQLGLGAWRNHTPAFGLPSELVWRFGRDAAGRLWAGTDRGLALWEGQTWRALPETSGHTVQNLLMLPDGGLLAAGTSNRLLHVAPGGIRARVLPGPESPGYVGGLRLFQDARGRIWALGGSLHRLEARGGFPAVERVEVPRGMGISEPTALTADGHVLFSGTRGLVAWRDGRWQRWGASEGLRSDGVSWAATAPDGTLWIAYLDALGVTQARRTPTGLVVLRHLTAGKGDLPTDAVFSLHPEPATEALWLLTNLGAVRLEGARYDLSGRPSGLLNPDMVQGAFHAAPDGRRWFGTSGGAVVFDPTVAGQRPPLPPPVVSELLVGGRRANLPGAGTVRIPPGGSSVEVLLGCLSFSRERALRYQVWLEGLEDAWQTQTEPRVRYPALHPGAYRLRARLLHDGQAGPEWTISLEVLPRWHQTWAFRLLVFLSAGPLLWGFLVLRNQHLRRQNQRLEGLVQDRTRELQEANARLQELSLTDPLTGLHNRRFLALTLPEQVARIQRDLLPAGGRGPERGFLEDHPLVFLVLDIDHFKHVNDDYGHECGDAVLRQLSTVLRSCVRDTDTLIRWGGEEFLVVARQVGTSDPAGLAERIRKAVAEQPFDLGDGRVIHKTISVGFSPFPLGNQVPSLPWEKVVLLADRALYAVKRTGRDGWIGLDEGPAFDAEILLASGGHPDIPDLLDQGVLHVVSSFSAVPEDAWI